MLATEVAIPALGGSLSFYDERFAGSRGGSVGSVLTRLLTDPGSALHTLATPSNAKIVIALIASTGGLALFAPRFLALAVPGLAANLLSAYSYQHDLHFHYQLVPAAAFALAGAEGAEVVVQRIDGRKVAAVLLAATAAVTVVSPALKTVRARGDAVAAKRHAVSLVPTGATVAAAPDLVAHLSDRRTVYQLPEPFFSRPDNGEYWSERDLVRRSQEVRFVVIDLGLDPYPKTQVEKLPAILRRRGYRRVFSSSGVSVFER